MIEILIGIALYTFIIIVITFVLAIFIKIGLNMMVMFHQHRIRSLHETIEATTSKQLRLLWTGKKLAHEQRVKELIGNV